MNKDGYLSLDELKCMMEVLGAPQTYIGLKGMIKEVDEDSDGRLIGFPKGLSWIIGQRFRFRPLARLTEVDVDKIGVNGAKEFFEAKIVELSKKSKFEDEIRQKQEERKRMEEERETRRQDFFQII